MVRVGIVLTMFIVFGCDSDESNGFRDPTNGELLQGSLERWEQGKPSVYSYSTLRRYGGTIDSEAMDTDGTWATVVAVEDGKVICRAFAQTGLIERDYKELGDKVGSHDFGSPAKTIANLYSDCSKIADNEGALFALDSDGYLSACLMPFDQKSLDLLSKGIDDKRIIIEEIVDGDLCSGRNP